jgi:4-amino-4-deoxy-L-arabinose transferase-like glycosyltransferase
MRRALSPSALLCAALLAIWCVGMFGRGFWTPDEPREADIAWRMSWQADKSVPLLAGEAFCEKPPLTYWFAAAPIELFGAKPWAVRLPNLLYSLVTALAIGLLVRRSLGPAAAWIAAAAMSTFLLSYQVAIWLATDAPLLAAVSVALLGAYRGFYA